MQMKTARGIALGLCLALVGCQPKTPSEAPPPSAGATLQSVAALAHVPTTKAPHGIAWANGRIYVCNVGSDVLTVLDAATGEKQADLTVQQGPTYAAASHDGTRLLVVNGASGSLSVIDADQSVLTIEGLGTKPDKVHETEDGHHAYVTLVGESAIAKVDLQASPPTVTKIPVGPAEGHRALVVLDDMVIAPNSAGNSVALIDRATDEVTSVSVGTKPGAVAVASYSEGGATRRVLVVGNGGSGTSSLVDLASKQVVETLEVGLNPSDAVAVGRYVYLTNSGSNTVSVLDVQGQTKVADIPVGTRPVHAFVPPAGGGPAGQVWIGCDGESFATILDTATRTAYARVECQGGHHKMAFTPDGKKAFITNLASNSVTVVDRTNIR